jgi:hypothetical protein
VITNAGYSGAPLPKKLGLKDGQVIGLVGLPSHLQALTQAAAFADVDEVFDIHALPRHDYDFVHLFTDRAQVIHDAVPTLPRKIQPDGMVWVSWPKKASKVPTDVTEDVIRSVALSGPLVDVKVCAVDEVWSGLKLVLRKELRPKYQKEQKG